LRVTVAVVEFTGELTSAYLSHGKLLLKY
jgi:hypothetical protein